MRHRFNYIILDLDGPILDGKMKHYNCYKDILLSYGYPVLPIDEYWNMKRNMEDRYQQLSMTGAVAIYQFFLCDWLKKIETKKYLHYDKLQENVIATLQHWKEDEIQLILVTMRTNPENLFWQLNEIKISHWFDRVVVVSYDQTGHNKAESVKQILKRNNYKSAIWIGDTEIDEQAARELNIKICLVSCGIRSRELLEKMHPDYLVTNIDSFSKLIEPSI